MIRSGQTAAGSYQTSHTVLLADARPGVRAALRWLLSSDPSIAVVAEAGGVAEARGLDLAGVDVVVAGLQFCDGVAADLVALGRPVVVHTWLPPDEWPDAWGQGCAAVLRHGTLRELLAPSVRAAAYSAVGGTGAP